MTEQNISPVSSRHSSPAIVTFDYSKLPAMNSLSVPKDGIEADLISPEQPP